MHPNSAGAGHQPVIQGNISDLSSDTRMENAQANPGTPQATSTGPEPQDSKPPAQVTSQPPSDVPQLKPDTEQAKLVKQHMAKSKEAAMRSVSRDQVQDLDDDNDPDDDDPDDTDSDDDDDPDYADDHNFAASTGTFDFSQIDVSQHQHVFTQSRSTRLPVSEHPNTASALQTILGTLDPSPDARFYKPSGVTSSDPDFIADKYTRPPVIQRSKATAMPQESNRTGIQFPGMRLNIGKTP